MKFAVNLKHFW